MKKLKQIMILNQTSYLETKTQYKKDMGENLTFEDYVNMVLGTLSDNGNEILEIRPNDDASVFVITYLMKIDKKV